MLLLLTLRSGWRTVQRSVCPQVPRNVAQEVTNSGPSMARITPKAEIVRASGASR